MTLRSFGRIGSIGTIGGIIGICLAVGLGACDSSDDSATNTGGGGNGGKGGGDATGGPSTTYAPFSQANLQNQLLRVGAYEQIQTIRKGESFKAADFGGACDQWSGDVTTPSDPTKLASLYVETAELAAKVAGRKDDHAFNLGAEVGKQIHGRICDAIAAGSAVPDTTGRDDLNGLGWHSQVLDKGLQHFFYQSVHHELVQGARAKWDEGFGYSGLDFGGDPAKASGIGKTAATRDTNCGTTYARDLHAALIQGRDQLDAALKAAGKSGDADALDTIPADLQETIDEIDRMLLEVFAISFAREYIGIDAGDKPFIKVIEGRMFFHILEPYIASVDAALAAKMAAEVAKDDPETVDTAFMIGAVKTVFGLDVPALCTQ
ncbi:MAG: hypothetical protein AMXMBFR64_10780 [Myxococcales bacterium]